MDRWQHISNLFHEVLAQSPATRDDYLRDACGDDDDLRRQIESLLSATEQTRTAAGTPGDASPREPLAPGPKLAHYQILSLLGAGGMGEVYRARDSQLQRDIAAEGSAAVRPSRSHRARASGPRGAGRRRAQSPEHLQGARTPTRTPDEPSLSASASHSNDEMTFWHS
jgi:serine/threonine protein kinase